MNKSVQPPKISKLALAYRYLAEVFDYLTIKGYQEQDDFGVNSGNGFYWYFNPDVTDILERSKPLCWMNLRYAELIIYKKVLWEKPNKMGVEVKLNVE